jgi:hypothetical protein
LTPADRPRLGCGAHKAHEFIGECFQFGDFHRAPP